MPAVTDRKDIRVLIPRMRRALDGPQATGSASPSTSLDDEQVTNVIADAIADVIFYSNGAFGHSLIVKERDDYYQAPVAWETSEELREEEATVIIAQAALNYFYNTLTEMKTQQTIRRADEEWSYTISATAMSERIKSLRDARDAALSELQSVGLVSEAWINTLLVRDARTDVLIEPYQAAGGFLPSGQEFDPAYF
jgi:hypothetical protein